MKLLSSLVFLSFFLFATSAICQDKVVVVPLFKSVKPLQNVITVSKSGGDFTDPVAAVQSITDAAEDNPYLVVIGPGEYILTEQLSVASYISIVGSGEYATRIGGAISGSTASTGALVKLLGISSSISNLYLENQGGGTTSVAIYAFAFTGTVENVTAIASGGTIYNYGIYNAISITEMTHVTAQAIGGTNSFGVYNSGGKGSAPTRYSRMTNVRAIATAATNNYGVYNKVSYPAMAVMAAVSDGYGLYIDDAAGTTSTYIRRSTLMGTANGALYTNVGSGVTYVSQSTLAWTGSPNWTKTGTGVARCVASDNNFGEAVPADCDYQLN